MKPALLLLALIIGGGMAYIRLAPSDPARWHVSIMTYGWAMDGSRDAVVPMKGAASFRLTGTRSAALGQLASLDAIALATPRTARLAGSPDEGRITWITRSRVFGFPDYTTADAREDGLYVYARQRFGRADFGVNARRLRGWLALLAS